MNNQDHVMTWFRNDSLPSIVDDPAIIIGGTSIVREFLAVVGQRSTEGRLSIAVPFVGEGVESSIGLWTSMNHAGIDLRIVLRSRSACEQAWKDFSNFSWKSVLIGWHPRLHAKMYAFENSAGGGAALIGSHNLSYSGLFGNEEAGVLFVSPHLGIMSVTISDLQDRILMLFSQSSIAVDTTSWPNAVAPKERRAI
jgi:hypothetical protein